MITCWSWDRSVSQTPQFSPLVSTPVTALNAMAYEVPSNATDGLPPGVRTVPSDRTVPPDVGRVCRVTVPRMDGLAQNSWPPASLTVAGSASGSAGELGASIAAAAASALRMRCMVGDYPAVAAPAHRGAPWTRTLSRRLRPNPGGTGR